MKKIQCIKCNEKWIIEDDKPPKLQVCPICGVNLWEKAIASDLDNTSIENALFNVICHSGIDVLKQKSRVIGMLSDLTKGMDKEIRIISRAYNQDVANLQKPGQLFSWIVYRNASDYIKVQTQKSRM